MRRGKTRAQSRTTTGHDAKKSAQNLASRQDKGAIPHHIRHDAKKTAKNFASRHGKIKHNTIQDTTQRKHSKTLRRGAEEGKKLATSSRFVEDARTGLHRIRTDSYNIDVHVFELISGGLVHAGISYHCVQFVGHRDEGESSLVYLA